MKDFPKIDSSKFKFIQPDTKINDVKLDTKPRSYYADAWVRFKKNKASLVAFGIIVALILFSLIAPLISSYDMAYSDPIFNNKKPKSIALSKIGIMRGWTDVTVNERGMDYHVAMGVGAADTDGSGKTMKEGRANEHYPIMTRITWKQLDSGQYLYEYKVDVYRIEGFVYKNVTQEQLDDIRRFEQESGIQVIYPMVDVHHEPPLMGTKYYLYDASNANYWYATDAKGNAILKNGEFVPLYLKDSEGNIRYSLNRGQTSHQIRVLYYNYYQYEYGREPEFFFGTNNEGKDIFIRLAKGAQISLALGIFVAVINFTIGALFGSLQGYLGGWFDLITERILEVISRVPTIITATLFQLHFVNTGKVSSFTALLFTFILTGWLGTAGLLRLQFYRFKHYDYVLAARTLGAGHGRLMFKHIFPNTLGTVVTSSILAIPGVIFAESALAYLGITSFNSGVMTSIGNLLSEGQPFLKDFPHILFFPAMVISLLMISFNLFGNGLRDAFNPSLRGAE